MRKVKNIVAKSICKMETKIKPRWGAFVIFCIFEDAIVPQNLKLKRETHIL